MAGKDKGGPGNNNNSNIQAVTPAERALVRDLKQAAAPDINRPFTDAKDACSRLLQFHVFSDHQPCYSVDYGRSVAKANMLVSLMQSHAPPKTPETVQSQAPPKTPETIQSQVPPKTAEANQNQAPPKTPENVESQVAPKTLDSSESQGSAKILDNSQRQVPREALETIYGLSGPVLEALSNFPPWKDAHVAEVSNEVMVAEERRRLEEERRREVRLGISRRRMFELEEAFKSLKRKRAGGEFRGEEVVMVAKWLVNEEKALLVQAQQREVLLQKREAQLAEIKEAQLREAQMRDSKQQQQQQQQQQLQNQQQQQQQQKQQQLQNQQQQQQKQQREDELQAAQRSQRYAGGQQQQMNANEGNIAEDEKTGAEWLGISLGKSTAHSGRMPGSAIPSSGMRGVSSPPAPTSSEDNKEPRVGKSANHSGRASLFGLDAVASAAPFASEEDKEASDLLSHLAGLTQPVSAQEMGPGLKSPPMTTEDLLDWSEGQMGTPGMDLNLATVDALGATWPLEEGLDEVAKQLQKSLAGTPLVGRMEESVGRSGAREVRQSWQGGESGDGGDSVNPRKRHRGNEDDESAATGWHPSGV